PRQPCPPYPGPISSTLPPVQCAAGSSGPAEYSDVARRTESNRASSPRSPVADGHNDRTATSELVQVSPQSSPGHRSCLRTDERPSRDCTPRPPAKVSDANQRDRGHPEHHPRARTRPCSSRMDSLTALR